ncbi:hypothetical protein PMAYCL1PPCAC_06112, partial [Pristionchus mayeri]
RLLHEKIITDELKIRSIQLIKVIASIEKLHPGATMEFVMEELERDPSSLPLRLRMDDIIVAVYHRGESDLTKLHEFIQQYPFIVAENYDTTLRILEKLYLKKSFGEIDKQLTNAIETSLEKNQFWRRPMDLMQFLP